VQTDSVYHFAHLYQRVLLISVQ